MLYIKVIIGGVAGAIGAVVLWVLVAFVLPMILPIVVMRLSASYGAGAGGASISSGSIVLAALIGFVAGAYWVFRRA